MRLLYEKCALGELLAIVADDGDERLPVDARASAIVLAAQLEALPAKAQANSAWG
jgi:hypothetical protein